MYGVTVAVPDVALEAEDNMMAKQVLASLLYGAYTLASVGLQKE